MQGALSFLDLGAENDSHLKEDGEGIQYASLDLCSLGYPSHGRHPGQCQGALQLLCLSQQLAELQIRRHHRLGGG